GCSACPARCRNRATPRATPRATAPPAEMTALDTDPRPPGVPALSIRVGARCWQVAPGEPVRIGRDRSCDVPIEDRRVSRQHATGVERLGGQRRVIDLGSRNRVLVNGVPADQPLPVVDGDRLSVGNTDLVVDGAGLLPVSASRSRLVADGLGYSLPDGRDLL